MKILDAIYTLRTWFVKNNLKLPKVTLSFNNPNDYYAFEWALRKDMMNEPMDVYSTVPDAPRSLDVGRGTVMGIEIEVKKPELPARAVFHMDDFR